MQCLRLQQGINKLGLLSRHTLACGPKNVLSDNGRKHRCSATTQQKTPVLICHLIGAAAACIVALPADAAPLPDSSVFPFDSTPTISSYIPASDDCDRQQQTIVGPTQSLPPPILLPSMLNLPLLATILEALTQPFPSTVYGLELVG
jgi:hypothetical protein